MFRLLEESGFKRVKSVVVPRFRFRQDSTQNAAEAEVAAKDAERRAANCELARGKLANYQTKRRIYRTDENGEVTEWLDVDEERAKAQAEVDEWCN